MIENVSLRITGLMPIVDSKISFDLGKTFHLTVL